MKTTIKLVEFLRSKGWIDQDIDSDHVFSLTPPQDLGFVEGYKLSIKKEIDDKYFERKIKDYNSLISDIYEINPDDISSIIFENKEMLSIRISDEDTKDGEINLSKFDYIIQKLSDILLKTADFVLENKIRSDNAANNPKANFFLNSCKFLQTQKGSFVTRISLPAKQTIRPANLFGPPIEATQVNEKIFAMINFVNDGFFADQEIELDAGFVANNKELINIDVLRDITSLYKHTRNIEFAYTNSNNYEKRKTKPKNISHKRIDKFGDFINKIEKDFIENQIQSFCFITGVYDRRLEDGKKNCINLISEQFGPKLEIHLDDVSDEIRKLAIDAYKGNERIWISGNLDELKSYLKITQLHQFKDINIIPNIQAIEF